MGIESCVLPAIDALAFFGNLAGPDLLLIGVLGLLLFGNRLPDVGKNLGKTIVQFKKGLSEAGKEISEPVEPEPATPTPAKSTQRLPERNTRQIKQLSGPSDEP